MCAAIAVGARWARPAAAEIMIVKTNTWELYTTGRVGGFFTYGWGDAPPIPDAGNPNAVPPVPPEDIPPGGGLDVGTDTIARHDAAGNLIQGRFASMRVRSGFVPNVLGIGFRRVVNDTTTLKAYIGLWTTIGNRTVA